MKSWRSLGLIVIAAALIAFMLRHLLVLRGIGAVGVRVIGIGVVRIAMGIDGYRMQDVVVTGAGGVSMARRSRRDAEASESQRKTS